MTPTWGDLIRRAWAIVRANYTLAQMTYYDELAAERQPFTVLSDCPPDESYTRPQGAVVEPPGIA